MENLKDGLNFSALSSLKKTEKILDSNENIEFKAVKFRRENYDDYLFRPSSLGRIATVANKPLTDRQHQLLLDYTEKLSLGQKLTERQMKDLNSINAKYKESKIIKLSDGAKTYLKQLVINDKFGRSKDIESKYLDKGIAMEEESIAMYSRVLGLDLHKNEKRLENEYFTGECDNCQGVIRDFKTSWDFTTFPILETELPNSNYYWQLQAYMDLWGIDESELIYCLVNTPFKMIDDELRRVEWKMQLLDCDGNVKDEKSKKIIVEKVKNMLFTIPALLEYCSQSSFIEAKWFVNTDYPFYEIPESERIKIFKVPKSEKDINYIKEIIKLARNYMNSLL